MNRAPLGAFCNIVAGVLSPLLANVYLHAFDRAFQQQKTFIGRLVRYADDFVIQCGTAEQAAKALEWVEQQMARLGLRLHPTKTRVVMDREGFDFLGFHHRRAVTRGYQTETKGLWRWPSQKACQRFRTRVRGLVGPPWRLRHDWSGRMQDLQKYLTGWGQYFRHGQSRLVFAKLDHYIEARIARNYARSQPTGKKRKPQRWTELAKRLRAWDRLPRLLHLWSRSVATPPGRAKVGWRAVSGRT